MIADWPVVPLLPTSMYVAKQGPQAVIYPQNSDKALKLRPGDTMFINKQLSSLIFKTDTAESMALNLTRLVQRWNMLEAQKAIVGLRLL